MATMKVKRTASSKVSTLGNKSSSNKMSSKHAAVSSRSNTISSFLKEKNFNSLKSTMPADDMKIPLEKSDTFCKIKTVFLPFDISTIDDEFLTFIKSKSQELVKLSKKLKNLLEKKDHWHEFLVEGESCLYLPSRTIMLPHPDRWDSFLSGKKRFSDKIKGDFLPEDFFKESSQCFSKDNPWVIFGGLKSSLKPQSPDVAKSISRGQNNHSLRRVSRVENRPRPGASDVSSEGLKFCFVVRRDKSNIRFAQWPFHPDYYKGFSFSNSDYAGKYVLPCFYHKESTLYSFLKAHITPNLAEYRELLDFYIQHPGWFGNDDTLNIDPILAAFHAGKTIWGWNRNELIKMGKEGRVSFYDKKAVAEFEEKLLKCDSIRFDGDIYKRNVLTDYHLGHWDLWPEEKQTKSETTDCIPIQLGNALYGRNPLVDIRSNGIVAIDFGTKSTSVAFLDGGRDICPFPIGCPKYQTNNPINEYENPTVLDFYDYNAFLCNYKKRPGRPFTQWSTLTVSHAANNAFEEGTDADSLASVVSELKQWTASGKKLYLMDHVSRKKDGKHLVFKPFLEIGDDEIDPVEIYAYYIGCFLNNMYNKIFLNYILSFSNTYDERTRNRIRSSFEKGLRKSLPNTVLNDRKSMDNFSVVYGCSEPEAYAVCALEQFELLPSKRYPKTFYGVFDFGGGTTDFDFGCCSVPKEDDGFDYYLEHFDANGYGDRYLGGENILRSMAYMVFMNNRKTLFSKNISFASSYEDPAIFANERKFVSDSLEAEMNTRLLMAKMRPLWEAPKSKDAKEFDSGEISLTLFNNSGEQCSGIKLLLDKDNLLRWIHDRISRGVANFFAALKSTFLNNPQLKEVRNIHIFLAGNSCKAEIVKEIFDKQCNAFVRNNKIMKDVFEIHLPLGENPQKKRMMSTREFYRPNGKTGVVWGLLLGRDGGAFRQKPRSKSSSIDTKFIFFIGRSVRGDFVPKLSPLSSRKWVPFRKANTHTIEFYYTTDPGASTGQVKADRFVCSTIKAVDEQSWIVIRPKTVASFEYAVAKSPADAEKQKFLQPPEELFLN